MLTRYTKPEKVCNLDCAVLLSKWLLTLASISPSEQPPTHEERNVLESVRTMLDETEFAVPIDPSLSGPGPGPGPGSGAASDGARLRQLAAAVVRLWAETFKGNHVFEVVRIMALGLEGYADLIEKPRDRTPLVRHAAGPSLG